MVAGSLTAELRFKILKCTSILVSPAFAEAIHSCFIMYCVHFDFPWKRTACSFLWFIMASWGCCRFWKLLLRHVFNSPSGIIHFHCLAAVQFRLPSSYKQFQLFFPSPFPSFEIMQLIAGNAEHLTPERMHSLSRLQLAVSWQIHN